MGIYLNPGNEKFASALRSQIYVDKTEMISYTNSVVDTEQRYICVSRPRRFGKSITADMIAAYYGVGCDSRELFAKYKASQLEDFDRHLNQYQVIQVDVNTFRHRRDKNTGETVTAMQTVGLFHAEVIKELRKAFPQSVEEKDNDLPAVLAKISADTGEKFVIIIDEWDTIFREDKYDEKAQQAYISLLRGLFKDSTSKNFLKLAYITGILPIKKYGTESAMNNFDEFTMLRSDLLAEYVGFKESEVISLCEKYHMDFEKMKSWYDGYVLEEGLHIYNPKSVVDAIRRKRIASYWTSTETYESLKSYITMNFDGLKDAIVQMLTGGRCKVNPGKFQNDMVSVKSKDDVLTLLLHLGYLAYDADRKEVRIPNEEVKEEFRNAVEDTGWDAVVQAIAASDNLLKATWCKDSEAVAEAIDRIHSENTSILNYNDENALSCVITLAYYNAVNEYRLIRELPTGYGFADIVFLPRKNSDKPAMIVELKWNQSAQTAIQQIKDKQYVQALNEYRGKLLLVGINYDRKSKKHACVIREIEY